MPYPQEITVLAHWVAGQWGWARTTLTSRRVQWLSRKRTGAMEQPFPRAKLISGDLTSSTMPHGPGMWDWVPGVTWQGQLWDVHTCVLLACITVYGPVTCVRAVSDKCIPWCLRGRWPMLSQDLLRNDAFLRHWGLDSDLYSIPLPYLRREGDFLSVIWRCVPQFRYRLPKASLLWSVSSFILWCRQRIAVWEKAKIRGWEL